VRRRRRAKSLALQFFELGVAAPQVIAHRMARAHDHAELQRMSIEKIVAWNEAWAAMAAQAFVESQKLAFPFSSRGANAAAVRILEKGMAPVRRRAVANAKRLRRSTRPSRTRR
jgi:hypothetical protein